MSLLCRNVRIVDEHTDRVGSVYIEGGIIAAIADEGVSLESYRPTRILEGGPGAGNNRLVLMPSFIDMHVHFREPGFSEKETLESGSLAAAAGGYGTVVCMANTRPVIDSIGAAKALRSRAQALGLIDLYPALALTRGMEGKDSSHLVEAAGSALIGDAIRMLSEDGKDIADDSVMLGAMEAAQALGLPVSCHCDAGGEAAATARAIRLAQKARCRVHIAHVSSAGALGAIRAARAAGFLGLTCEATPHHLALTRGDALSLGEDSWGRVAPPLGSEADRAALLAAVQDGTVDALATDHAPHRADDKLAGAPGFMGLETAFAVYLAELVRTGLIPLGRLSALLSANPARILSLPDRGLIRAGLRADLVLVDMEWPWTVRREDFRSRGANSPFIGRRCRGRVLMTLRAGSVVYDRSEA
ncbi:MAG TPA: dihydroorotase [bacterium]|nr:dihydroorotase [bacterium]